MSPVCRFAPSPNGPLHLGHAFSALRNATVAARLGGRLLLRMENIDLPRCSPAFETAIADDLAWLGVEVEQPVRRQSEHLALYGAALDTLSAHALLYPCFCTRGDIARAIDGRPDWPRDPDGSPLYPGTCHHLPPAARARRLAAAEPHALRLDTARALTLAGAPPRLDGSRRRGEGPRDRGGARRLGRRRAAPQGHPGELSHRGGGG